METNLYKLIGSTIQTKEKKSSSTFMLKFRQFIFVFAFLILLLLPDLASARRGSFGGSRSFSSQSFRSSKSFGSSRSFGGFRSKSTPSRIYNNSERSMLRNQSIPNQSSKSFSSQSNSIPRTSFGGTALSSNKEYASRYGRPRKTETVMGRGINGVNQNYIVNDYGGYSSGLMSGYLMGRTSALWYTPFHPAFYYSRPYYVTGANGQVEVYPPTFSFGKLLFTLMLFIIIIYVIRQLIKQKGISNNNNKIHHSSFS